MAANRGTRRGNGFVEKPSTGAGWGGPAKGASSQDARPFTDDTPTRQTIPGGQGDPAKMAQRAARKAELESRADGYLDLMHEIAHDRKEPTPNRLAAMDKAANRILGTPTQNVNVEGSALAIVKSTPLTEDEWLDRYAADSVGTAARASTSTH